MRKIPPFWSQVRNYTALASAFIYNLNVFGISAKNICSPGFNCHGCPWATFSCPVGIIGYGFGVRSIPAFAIGSVLAIGIFLGRLVCGYACPFGLLQELLFRIKSKKFSLPKPVRYLKYVIMVLTVFLLTYIFGFDVEEGYIRVNKPVVAKDTPELDQNIFAEKNRGYFDTGKYDITVTEGGFPVPKEFKKKSEATGLKAVGLGAGGDSFSFDEIVEETADDPFKQESNQSNDTVDSILSTVGFGDSGIADLTGETSSSLTKTSVSNQDGSVFDLLQRSKDKEYEDTDLLVEVTVENMSVHSMDKLVLIPVYYESGTGVELWRGEDKVYNVHLGPGEIFTTEIFTVPYYLHKADIAILSPQTSVVMNYWSLFCTYCPVAAIEADIPSKLANVEDLSQLVYATTKMSPIRIGVTLFVIIASIFISRFFCRALCPLGAMYGLVAKFSIIKVAFDKNECINCGRCDSVCPVELDVRKEVGCSECLSCGDCINACPTAALKRKAGL